MVKDYKTYKLTKEENIKYFFICISVSFVLAYLAYDNLLFSVLFSPLIIFGKKFYIQRLIQVKKNELLLEFKDFLYLISTSFSLGRNMEQAIRESISSLINIYGEKSILTNEMNNVLLDIEKSNGSEVDLLKDFALRSDLEDIKDFVQVYENCKISGGEIIEAINSAATIIADKITVEGEIKSSTVQKKTEGRMISLAPFIIILFLKITSPDYIRIMYETISGRIIMILVIIAVVVAFLITERITKIEI